MAGIKSRSLMSVCLILSLGSIAYPYSGGSGSSGDPFQISSVADWETLMASPGDWGSSFILTKDLDMAKVIVTPVGNIDVPFVGVFDGNGHFLSNAVIDKPAGQFVGLFGMIMTGGEIRNLGAENIAVSGFNDVGTIAGQNYGGVITGCYATGAVNGMGGVGGLAGSVYFGWIDQCYAIVSVTNSTYDDFPGIGGLVGTGFMSSFRGCFSAGPVIGAQYVGGFLGYDTSNTITACFWDMETSGTNNGVANIAPDPFGVRGKSTAEMKTLETFTNLGWDFFDETIDNTPAVWKMNPDQYPTLAWQHPILHYTGGSGTAEDPFQIANLEDLKTMAASPGDWDKYFIVTANIDMSSLALSTALIASDADPYTDGFQGTAFSGSFNGNFQVLSNLSIVDTVGRGFLGFFGKIDTGGRVSNLLLENASVTLSGFAGESMGLLAAEIDGGEVCQCGVNGTVRVIGDNDYNYCFIMGGLVGNLANGTIARSFSYVSILKGFYTGGLVGLMTHSVLSDCYASGSVTGTNIVGGLVGSAANGITIDRCYSVGSVTGWKPGGLVGSSDGTVPADISYWDITTSHQELSAVGFGVSQSWVLKQRSTFEYLGWDFIDLDGTPAVWRIREGQDYPRLVWQPLIPGDIAGSPAVDEDDLGAMAEGWGQSDCTSGCDGDLNSDGRVDMEDFAIISAHWGKAASTEP